MYGLGIIEWNIISDWIWLCSGEKAKTSEWPTMVEVKGRVRLSAFGKFVQELPLSRSRVLMVYKVYYLHYHCSSISIRFSVFLVTTLRALKDPQISAQYCKSFLNADTNRLPIS